jgi:HAD superfamily hydrolase (TIGR01509 family)
VAETERDGHRIAFNQAFEQLGLPWRWNVPHYGELLYVTGGRERLLHDMAARQDAPADTRQREQLAGELHRRKNLAYARLVAQGGITPRPGVLRLVDACRAGGVALAVATTTSRSNVEALFGSLWGPAWERIFTTVVCAEDAPVKKPHPQAYLLALQRLGVSATEAFALEDSPGGLAAARAAGLACGVTKSIYFADAAFDGAAWVRDDLDAPPPMTLARVQDTLAGSIAAS